MSLLHLNLKGEYFDQIKAGEKTEEYRVCSMYWWKRLTDKHFDGILIKKGYPKRGDSERTLFREWNGYTIKTITHPHFGKNPVQVFAIKLTDRLGDLLELAEKRMLSCEEKEEMRELAL